MRIQSVDLNLLVVLHAVLGERSVARAASRLHVTPSAISNSLRRLRDVFDDPLFVRSGRGIVPTPRAVALAPSLARLLGELDTLVGRPSDLEPSTTERTFTLAVADAGQLARVPRLAARMRARMPKARLRVIGIDSLAALGGLAGTEVDAVVGAGELGPDLHFEKLYDEEPVLVARRGHPATRAPIGAAALAKLRHVGVSMGPRGEHRDITSVAYEKARIVRDVAVTVPGFASAAAVAAATDLVATIPKSLFETLGPALGVARVVAPAPTKPVEIRLTWHERTHADPTLIAFRRLLAEAWSATRERRRSRAARHRA